MAWRIGVDIGGTFTDVVLVDEASGRIGLVKLLTTSDDFSRAVVAGLNKRSRTRGARPGYRPWPGRAAGARDDHRHQRVVREKGRPHRARHDLRVSRPARTAPLVARRSVRSVSGPARHAGAAALAVRDYRADRGGGRGGDAARRGRDRRGHRGDPRRRIGECRGRVAVLVPQRRARAASRRAIAGRTCRGSGSIFRAKSCPRSASSSGPARPLSAPMSESCSPPISTGCNAPPRSSGCRSLYVMGSSGGMFDVAEALRMPAMAVESGPAAGVVAAQLAGAQLGIANLISFDMGGTTAKASLIAGGEITVTAEYEVGGGQAKRWLQGTGHPVRVPVIDLAEVSAGGGSIAWVDPGGSLRVGPESAGAMPGPAAYGRGGTQADCQRRRYRARLARPRGAARRRSADRRGRGRESHHARDRGAARAVGCRGRREDRGDRQRQHGRSAAHRLGRTRPRSARLRTDRVRWGRARCMRRFSPRNSGSRRSSCRRRRARSRRWASSPAM